MNDFIPQLVTFATRLQVCPSPSLSGLIVSGKEILDVDFGTLVLVEDVLLTELVPSIIVHSKVVSPSSSDVKTEIKCYKLENMSVEDMSEIKAVISALKPYQWSVPHWLSVNQLNSLLTTGEWLPDWGVPVQPTR